MKSTIHIRLRIYLTTFLVLMLCGVLGFIVFEKMSVTDAIYFTIVTMATVGYGDIHPQTQIGKILALIIIVGGVGTFLSVIAGITDLFVNRREAASREQKVEMVMGLFFSEMGNALLSQLVHFDPEVEPLQRRCAISVAWADSDFEGVRHFLTHRPFIIDSNRGDIIALLQLLQDKADLLLRLIENPSMQEHEHFTEFLRALFHLRDELSHRKELTDMPDSDRRHLEGDIARVYKLLLFEWLRHVRYLQKSYAYLFSLAVRLNPFNPNADAQVK